jgi:hypothetical protein
MTIRGKSWSKIHIKVNIQELVEAKTKAVKGH